MIKYFLIQLTLWICLENSKLYFYLNWYYFSSSIIIWLSDSIILYYFSYSVVIYESCELIYLISLFIFVKSQSSDGEILSNNKFFFIILFLHINISQIRFKERLYSLIIYFFLMMITFHNFLNFKILYDFPD